MECSHRSANTTSAAPSHIKAVTRAPRTQSPGRAPPGLAEPGAGLTPQSVIVSACRPPALPSLRAADTDVAAVDDDATAAVAAAAATAPESWSAHAPFDGDKVQNLGYLFCRIL